MTFATTDSGIKALGMFLCSHVARRRSYHWHQHYCHHVVLVRRSFATLCYCDL